MKYIIEKRVPVSSYVRTITRVVDVPDEKDAAEDRRRIMYDPTHRGYTSEPMKYFGFK